MTAPRIAVVFRGIGDIGGTNNTIADHAREFTRQGYAVDLIGEKVHRGGVSADICLLYTSPSPRDKRQSRMPSSA